MSHFDNMTIPQMASILRWGSNNRSIMLSAMCLRILKGELVPALEHSPTTGTVWCASCSRHGWTDSDDVERHFRSQGWRKRVGRWVCSAKCGKKVTLPAQAP